MFVVSKTVEEFNRVRAFSPEMSHENDPLPNCSNHNEFKAWLHASRKLDDNM
jgi:hypothetical protein